ncbi:hypothetical protein NVIE_2519 [Nitrososphaera viennensis EN76]|uniref:Uncharacterized protein n=1 Tax=Nitrososphaera viennensis EN76 TaxID=926571 RepID=A0A060HTC6_9ARCH|nr:hypothetical protein NVIE_2519 [Nitrososphaera viennensis EN76]
MDNGATMSFLRRGKEAIRLGKDARPTLSKLITRSGDIQMSSVRELAKLKGDLKSEQRPGGDIIPVFAFNGPRTRREGV